MHDKGSIALALAAGVLFGVSTPSAKRLAEGVDPWMLAGLLYLGSGVGLGALRTIRKLARGSQGSEPKLRGADRWWLAAAIAAGGVLAPVLMMYGLKRTTASSASLLLNLEGVFSVLLAWWAFRENFDRRVALGVVAITAGALVLSLNGELRLGGALGPVLIVCACLGWAIDNNLTRKIALSDVLQIAMFKGLTAGAVNVSLALILGASVPSAPAMLAAGIVGFGGYGLSLVLFIVALRHLGAARTSAYFSVAPFAGALVAVIIFKDPLTLQLAFAGALMAIGLWLHFSERHEHEHAHELINHDHTHVHDAHHQHDHGSLRVGAEPHAHAHTHQPMRHTHPHYPDAHHRHVH